MEYHIYSRMFVPLLIAISLSAAGIAAQTKDPQSRESTMDVSVTAFCVSGKTRSGSQTKDGVAAADPRVIPLGSRVQVEGLTGDYDGTYIVTDTGRAVKGRELDIFIADCAAAKRFGRQDARVRVLKRGAPKSPGPTS